MRIKSRNIPTDFLVYASYFAMALFLFIPYLIRGEHAVFHTYDDLGQWYPYRMFWVDCIRKWRSFAWYPGVYCGLPFIAWSHSSSLYPLAILNFFFSFRNAVTWEIALHVFIFTSGAYYMLRRFDCSPGSSWICAAHVGTGIFLIYGIGHFLPEMYTMSWTTWSTGFWAAWVSGRRLRHLAGFVLCYSMELFGGHVEAAFYHAMTVGAIYGSLALFNAPGWRVWDRLKTTLPAGALICLLAFVLLLPGIELVGYSVRRNGMTYEYFSAVTRTGLGKPLDLPFDQAIVYASLIVALLWFRKVKRIVALLVLVPVVLVIQWDIWGALRLVYRLPVFNTFILTYKLYIALILIVLLIMGFVMDEFGRDGTKAANWFLMALVIFAAFHVVEGIIGQRFIPVQKDLSFPALGESISKGLYARSAGSAASIILLLCLLLRRKQGGNGGRPMMAATLLFFLAVFPASFCFLPRLKGDPFTFNPELKKFAADHSKEGRFATVFRWGRLPSEIPPQMGGYWGTRGIDACVRGPFWWYARYLQQIAPVTIGFKGAKLDKFRDHYAFKGDDIFHKEALHLLNFLGLRYVIPYKNNFKLLSDYYFSFDPSIENRYTNYIVPSEGRGESGGAFDLVAKLPFNWSATLHVLPGDELRFGSPLLETRGQKDGDTTALALIYARSVPGPDTETIFEQALGASSGSPPQMPGLRSISLDKYANKTIELSFVARTTKGEGRIRWRCPHIYHHLAPFEKMETRTFDVYENRSALPRLTIATRFVVFPEEESRLKFLSSGDFKPPDLVLLEEYPHWEMNKNPSGIGENSVAFVSDEADRLVVEANLSGPAIVVIADVYCPGWTLKVNGEKIKILKANEAFRAAPLKRGKSIIEMTYHPFSIRTGLWTSITSWLFFAGLVIFRHIKAAKRANL